MMRLTMVVWWSLALVWFVTSQAGAEPVDDERARLVKIEGHGVSIQAAEQKALREAVEALRLELRQRQLDYWQPTESQVMRLLDGKGHAGADAVIDSKLAPFKTWIVTLKIPGDEMLQELDRQAKRQSVSETRMSMALRMLALLAVTLCVLVGGIRLDEWTHSRYARWLSGAGAGVFLAIAAVGWWWLR